MYAIRSYYDLALHGKGLGQLPGGFTEALPGLGVGRHSHQPLGQGGDVARLDQDAAPLHQLGNPAHGRGENGQPGQAGS